MTIYTEAKIDRKMTKQTNKKPNKQIPNIVHPLMPSSPATSAVLAAAHTPSFGGLQEGRLAMCLSQLAASHPPVFHAELSVIFVPEDEATLP